MYSVEFTEKAAKTLRKLDSTDREAILVKVYSIRESPFSHLKKLARSKLWRLRVGKYRVIMDVLIKGTTIYVLKIDKRERVY